MEEEKKINITTKGLVNINSPLSKQVEEMSEVLKETPGTAGQLKQYYTSEHWQDVAESLGRISKKFEEAIKPVIITASKVARELHKVIMIAFSTEPKVKKCYGIYKRTKKRKDKKKTNVKDK